MKGVRSKLSQTRARDLRFVDESAAQLPADEVRVLDASRRG